MYKRIYKSMQTMSLVVLVVTAILVLTSLYSIYKSRVENEIKNEALIIRSAFDASDNSSEYYNQLASLSENPQFIVSTPDNEIVFSTLESPNEHNLEKIIKADGFYNWGIGLKYFYYSTPLSNGNILTLVNPTHDIESAFKVLIICIIFILGMMYILCVIFAVNLTQSIIKPISKINLYDESFDDTYEELIPILKKISSQNFEIKRQVDKVNRHRLRLQIVSENMNEGLIVLNSDREIISQNSSAREIIGTAPTDGSYQNISSVNCYELISKSIDLAYSGKKINEIISINDNSYRVFFSPVFEGERLFGVIILILDVNEEEKSLEIRKEFTANVSHELKTPLTTIMGYSQIINNDIARPEDIKGFTQKIEKECTRLITLIDDIIKLSQLDEEKEIDLLETIDLLKLSNEIAESLSHNANKKGIATTIVGNHSFVVGNLAQITELIYNLYDNAIKYNVDGGKIKITVSDKTFRIDDSGIGIPKEYQARIFERFFRVDKSHSKKVNGTGLGLSIVKHIAMCHDAAISVEASPLGGTSFIVKFKK